MKSRRNAGTSISTPKRRLGSATLTVAVLILFLVLVLTALLLTGLAGLTGLAALLTLSGLSRLTALLTLPGLATLALSELIPLFLHIVCHKIHSPRKARNLARFRDLKALSTKLVAARDCKGWGGSELLHPKATQIAAFIQLP
ncbi:MAG TPA: hypothetical protein VN911_02505 [Candidatus Acidoferrum sp.]|nr:hypothetical protein [Candidatus Acidoferrum sp.]